MTHFFIAVDCSIKIVGCYWSVDHFYYLVTACTKLERTFRRAFIHIWRGLAEIAVITIDFFPPFKAQPVINSVNADAVLFIARHWYKPSSNSIIFFYVGLFLYREINCIYLVSGDACNSVPTPLNDISSRDLLVRLNGFSRSTCSGRENVFPEFYLSLSSMDQKRCQQPPPA